jgi:phosphate/sulfate permease
LDERIRRSKKTGKTVLVAVVLVSLVFAVVLTQGLSLALEASRSDLVIRALVGLGLLAGLNLFSVVLIRRQHRVLDEAREELEALVRGDLPV